MRVNYKELEEQYNQSGLTMKDFGSQMGMSSNMVSYYLKKARMEATVAKATKKTKSAAFSPIEVKMPKSLRVIRISTSDGLSIEIPI